MTLETKITKIILSHIGVHIDDIKPESRFLEDFNFDSLDCVELVLDIESKFDCDIEDDQLVEVKTVQQLFNLMRGIVEL